jgi:hypothetical protein
LMRVEMVLFTLVGNSEPARIRIIDKWTEIGTG